MTEKVVNPEESTKRLSREYWGYGPETGLVKEKTPDGVSQLRLT